MGKELKLFFIGIANSFVDDSYDNIVTPNKGLGSIIRDTNYKRGKASRRISKVTTRRLSELERR